MKIMSSFSSLCFSKNNVYFFKISDDEKVVRTKRSDDEFVSYARTGTIK